MLTAKSAAKVNIILDVEVTGKKSYKTSEIQYQILSSLFNAYSPEASDIGGSVRISDIYALIDNLESVDYLHLKKFYTKPWPTTVYGNKELILGQFQLDEANGSMSYFISFSSGTEFTVRAGKGGFYYDGQVGKTTQIRDTINGFIFALDIQDNGYQSGFRYTITIAEPNKDYTDPGYNIPVFEDSSQLTLKVNEIV